MAEVIITDYVQALTTVILALLPMLFAALMLAVLGIALFMVFLFIDIKSTSEKALDLYIKNNRQYLK